MNYCETCNECDKFADDNWFCKHCSDYPNSITYEGNCTSCGEFIEDDHCTCEVN